MQTIISYNKNKNKPVITITSETEAENLSLDLVSQCDDISIVLELDKQDDPELVVKNFGLKG